MFKKYLNLILGFTLIFNQTALMSADFVGISVDQRAQEISNMILYSDQPSDLPVAGISEYFDKENINLIKDMDVSQYDGMKIFAGYGIFDQEQDNCQYIGVPGKTDQDFINDFNDINKYNYHSYGLYKNRVTFDQCFAITAEYGGYPVIPDSSSENYFIKRNYSSNDNIWVGVYRDSCSDIYKNAIQRTQFFTNFAQENEVCSEYKKHLSMNEYGKWEKVSKDQIFSCVVEWDSIDYTRPIKVCAPWWKVYREYQNNDIGLVSERELKRINQADIPAQLNICIRYDDKAVEAQNTATPRDVTCTTYYSATIAPECLFDSHQEQCFVDECGGYIRNACRLKFKEVTGKGYVKGQVISNGQKVSVRVKDQVETNVFTCPASPPSNKLCLDSANVLIFPKECPGSNCEALKECLYGAVTDADVNNCETQYTCEKIYAIRDIPPLLDENGNVLKLYGKCNNGDILEFDPNILDKEKRTCLEYEQIEVTKNIKEKCITNRNFTDHEVNVALNEVDIYQDNENCLRIDTVEDSQSVTPVDLSITANNYFKHKISQVYTNKDQEVIFAGGSDSYMLDQMNAGRTDYNSQNDTTIDESATNCTVDLTCSTYISSEFATRNQAILLDSTGPDPKIGKILFETDSTPYSKIYDMNSTECNTYATDHGFNSYVVNRISGYEASTDRDYCIFKYKQYTPDSQYSEIKLAGDEINYVLKGDTTKRDCLSSAICLQGSFNEGSYGASYDSTATCSVVTGETPSEYMDYLVDQSDCEVPQPITLDSNCEPNVVKSLIHTELNGFESIIAFEDYITGTFGYYSNFITKLPVSNRVSVTTDEITTAKAIFPLVDLSNISDYQRYVSNIVHTSYRSKKVDTLGQVVIGASTGAGVWALGPGGIVVGAVAFVIIALITPSRPMDSQYQSWYIYKNVPTAYHSRFENRKEILSTINVGYANSITGGANNWLYLSGNYNIPKMDPGMFTATLLNITNTKKMTLKCSGYDDNNINKMIHPAENGPIGGYPSCKWYNIWCEKSSTFIFDPTASVSKTVNTVFSGADETVTFLVPYQDNFVVKAYDKYDNIIGTVELTSDSFINMTSDDQLKFAQVKFGHDMQLASGINETNACRTDYMVEWGGGVSGAYHENSDTGTNSNCMKSNDTYVGDHSAVKITIEPENLENAVFTFKLARPLPFANRVFIGTLDKMQVRKYRCYEDFQECNDENYGEVQ